MKLQVAIDRVSLEKAVELSKKLNGVVDIIEIGTSLIKDYGNLSIQKISEVVTESKILVDSKTIDEGKYEFSQAFKHGADIVTVMGAATNETLESCYSVAENCNKTMMIDLLNIKSEQIENIPDFPNVIWLLHHSLDSNKHFKVVDDLYNFRTVHINKQQIGIAGGIDLQTVKKLKGKDLVDIVVVGSKIIKNGDPVTHAKQFMEAIQ